MKKIISMVACATVVLMVCGIAMAEEGKAKGKGPKGPGLFEKSDVNKDGKLTLDEFKATCKDPTKAEAKFQAADADKDGFLTKEELKAAAGKGKKGPKAACDKPADAPAPAAPAAQ